MSTINWLIDIVPFEDREEICRMERIEIGDVIGYHVTTIDNVEGIKTNGIIARSSRQSYDRPAATYFFMDKDEITEQMIEALVGEEEAIVIEFTIPRSEFLAKAKWDGLHNVSFYTASAVQFFGDIKKEWIR